MILPPLRLTRVLCLLLALVACSGPAAPQPPTAQPPIAEPPVAAPPTLTPPAPLEPQRPLVIYDTDFGIDVDDVGGLALLHALADLGEVTLLGVVSNVSDPYAPAAIDVINTYYGRPDLPIGLTDTPYYSEAYPYWLEPSPRYIKTLAERFPHDTPTDPAQLPTAVATYRELLAAAPDGSVTLVSVGFLQNLAGLLDSKPDALSALSGTELVRQKVAKLVIMGGHYPTSDNDLYMTGGREMDASYAVRVIREWPTTTVFNTGPLCQDIANGRTLADETPEMNPVRAAYTLFFGREGRSRTSWDLCSVLYSVRGLSGPEGDYFDMRTDEHLTLDASGTNAWVSPGNGRHERLTRVMDADTLQALFEGWLTTPPARP